jgi:hypothetical protein
MRGSDGKTLVAINLQEATSARSRGSDRADAETAGLEEPPPATQPAHPAPGTSEPVAADERVPAVPPISADVERAVRKLEEAAGRTKRGRTNMLGAAQYLGKSREWLRKLHLRGEGPHRAPDSTYSYDDLDAFSEKRTV